MILVRRSPSPYSRRCGLPPSPVCRIASQLRSSGVGRLIETAISTSPGAPPEGFTARFSIFGTACAGIARNGAATKRTAKAFLFMCSPPLWVPPGSPEAEARAGIIVRCTSDKNADAFRHEGGAKDQHHD